MLCIVNTLTVAFKLGFGSKILLLHLHHQKNPEAESVVQSTEKMTFWEQDIATFQFRRTAKKKDGCSALKWVGGSCPVLMVRH